MERREGGTSTVSTIVLVGRTGNGKSATGNSILGRKAFQCRSGSSTVRGTCELQQLQMRDGRKLNVIDTPGLFDPTVNQDVIGKEIAKCIDLAKDGVHAVLFVLSVRNRYTPEEAAALQTLQMLFGEKILNYMVVIFTGGDELEENEETLEDYLREIPLDLQEWSSKHKDVDSGRYSNEQVQIYMQNIQKAQEEQLKESQEMVEEHLRMATKVLEQRVAEQRSAREEIEKKSREKIRELEEQLRIREDSASRNPKRLPFPEPVSLKLRQFCTVL